jgi:hypothetical protein
MKRKILMTLLAVGTLGGYALGIRSVCHGHARRAAFERHVAELCTDAARGAHREHVELPAR